MNEDKEKNENNRTKNYKIHCICEHKYQKKFDKTERAPIVHELKKSPECFNTIKCIKLVFDTDNKMNNILFYFFTFMVGSHVPLWCYYLSTGTNFLKKFLNHEMAKFGYLKKKIIPKKLKKDGNEKVIINNQITENESTNQVNQINQMKIINVKNNNYKTEKMEEKSNEKLNEKLDEKSTQRQIQYKENEGRKINIFYSSFMLSKISLSNIEELSKEFFNYNLISINVKNPNPKSLPKLSTYILDDYSYEESIKYDKRSFCEIFLIFLKSEDIIISTFNSPSPFKQITIRICAFLFFIGNIFFFNTILYSNKKIQQYYKYEGNIFSFTFKFNIQIIFISMFISYALFLLVGLLTNYSYKMRELFRNEEAKLRNDNKYIMTSEKKREIYDEMQKIIANISIKNTIFLIVEVLIMIFYWYYVTAFCHSFTNTQFNVMLDSFFSFVFIYVVNILICMIFSLLYQLSIKKNFKLLYNVTIFFYYL
jgi:hypothetical protein